MASYWAPTNYKEQEKQERQQQQSDSVLPADVEDFLQTQQICPEPAYLQSQPAYFEDVTTTTTTTTTATTTNAASGKKRSREDKLGLKDYTAVSKKLRQLGQSELLTIGEWQTLANCKPGEVFVVDSCEEKSQLTEKWVY